MAQWKLRNAVREDVQDVYRLVCALEDKQLDLERFSAFYVANLNDNRNVYLVAESEEKLVGLLTCHGQGLLHHERMTYEVQELMVSEEFRSQGIGQALLKSLEEELKGRDVSMLEVASNVRRTRAHEFYLREEFERSHYKFTKKCGHE